MTRPLCLCLVRESVHVYSVNIYVNIIYVCRICQFSCILQAVLLPYSVSLRMVPSFNPPKPKPPNHSRGHTKFIQNYYPKAKDLRESESFERCFPNKACTWRGLQFSSAWQPGWIPQCFSLCCQLALSVRSLDRFADLQYQPNKRKTIWISEYQDRVQ